MNAYRSSKVLFCRSSALPAAIVGVVVATSACNSDNSSPMDASLDTITDTTMTPGSDAGDAALPSDARADHNAEAGTGGNDAGSGGDGAVLIPRDAGDAGDGGTFDAEAGPLGFGASVWGPIVSAHCIGCHGVGVDGGPGIGMLFGNLDMGDAAVAYANLVGDAGPDGGGVFAQGIGPGNSGITCASLAADAGLKRVVPLDAVHSLLFNKVASKEDGGPPVFCGNPMPSAGAPLAPADLATVQAWINQGANP